jgi:hypothetical protein
MNRIVVLVALVALLGGIVPAADGAFISNVTSVFNPPTNQGFFQSGGGGFLDPVALPPGSMPVPNAHTDGTVMSIPGTEPAPWVWLVGNATDLFQKMGPEIDVAETLDFAPFGRAVHEYAFRITLTNNLNHPISPVHMAFENVNLLPADFNQIEFFPLSFASWDGMSYASYVASRTGQYDSTWNTQFILLPQNELLFGGLGGGGGQLLPGQTGDLWFGIRFGIMTASTSGTIRFALVPSPEPTSLLLGALGLIGGVLLVRRRRNKKAAQDIQPQA